MAIFISFGNSPEEKDRLTIWERRSATIKSLLFINFALILSYPELVFGLSLSIMDLISTGVVGVRQKELGKFRLDQCSSLRSVSSIDRASVGPTLTKY